MTIENTVRMRERKKKTNRNRWINAEKNNLQRVIFHEFGSQKIGKDKV